MLLFLTTLNDTHLQVSILVIFLVLCNHHQDVYLLFNWILCQVKNLVWKLSLNVSKIDTSVSPHASLNPGNIASMPVCPVRDNISKDYSHFYYVTCFNNCNTNLITEKYKRLATTPSNLFQGVWGGGWGWSRALFLFLGVKVWFAASMHHLFCPFNILLLIFPTITL